MKKRFIYTLLFGIPGFFVAVIIAFFSIGAWTGLLWVFVFGDNPWPSMTEGTLFILFTVIFLLVWIILMAIGFSIGRKLENDPLLNKQHILLSGVITLLFILMIAIQQLSVGDIGPKSDGVLCSDYCLLNGYSGSGMPPSNSGDRTCSCYDDFGNEVLKEPLEIIEQKLSK